MSFDLFVLGETLEGENLSEFLPFLQEMLSTGCGINVEWHPDFNWSKPFNEVDLPCKVSINSTFTNYQSMYGDSTATNLVWLYITCEKESELIDTAKELADGSLQPKLDSANVCYGFHTSATRTPLSFLLQAAFASCLSWNLDGILLDPQDDQGYFSRGEAVLHMMRQARGYEAYCRKHEPESFAQAPFTDWPMLEVH